MASGETRRSQPPRMSITLFGGFAVQVDGRDVPAADWKRRSAAALVKILALEPGHRLHREQLMELLWPDSAPEQASNNLHQALYAARRALGGEGGQALMLHDQIIQFAPGLTLAIDAEEFKGAVKTARRQQRAAGYRDALRRYRGELLPEDRFEPWAEGPREALRALFAEATLELAELDDGEDGHAALLAALEQVVADDPLHEPAARALIRVYAETGQRHRALRQFESLQATLAGELSVTPEPATVALVEQIRAGELSGRAPPEKSRETVQQSARLTNLPEPVNRFIGRQRELARVRQALDGTRLLTLTGPGGCGKTRLALEVARGAAGQYEGGVWLVELASLSDPALIPHQIAAALGIREFASQSITELLVSWLRSRRILLVLDNCEHLIEASARIVETLLQASPGLTVMATSREPLRIPGEATWVVPSLSLPDPARHYTADELLGFEAVQLFAERAGQATPSFALTDAMTGAVAELCYRLDGIPLALELAAARTRALSVEQIVARLDDRFRLLRAGSRVALSHQQTLQATVDWSYDLLDEPERALFARLSVFAGGFTLEAAEAVCGQPPLDPADILDLLSSLVDRSLVVARDVAGGRRYRLLETMRQYGQARLEEAGAAEDAARAHAAYYAALGERGSREIRAAGQRDWLELLEREHDNLRATLDWLRRRSAQRDIEAGLLLAGQLHWFWHLRGHFSEGRAWLEQLMTAAGERDTVGYAMALTGFGDLALAIGDYAEGRAALAQATELWRELDDPPGLALALLWRGFSELFHGRVAAARTFQQESLTLFSDVGDRWGIAMAWVGLGFDAAEVHDLAAAGDAYGRALAIFRELGDDWGIATALQQIAHLTYRSGDFAAARAHVDEVLKIEQRMGDDWLEVQSHGLLGEIARASGDIDTAEAASNAGLAIASEMGNFVLHAWTLRDAGFVALERGRTDLALTHLRDSLTLFRERDYPLGIACCLIGLAGVAARRSDPALAARLLGAAEGKLARIGLALAPADRIAGERFANEARQALGDDAFERESQEGAAAAIADVLDLAMPRLGADCIGNPA